MRIFIVGAATITLDARPSSTIKSVKAAIAHHMDIQHKLLRLELTRDDGALVEDGRTLSDCRVEAESALHLTLHWFVQIFIAGLGPLPTKTLMVALVDTVGMLKQEILLRTEVSVRRLIFGGRLLSDDYSLAACGIGADSTVHAILGGLNGD